jgi:hypothetical protein
MYERKCENGTFWSNKRVRLLRSLWDGNMSDHSGGWCLLIEYEHILTGDALNHPLTFWDLNVWRSTSTGE